MTRLVFAIFMCVAVLAAGQSHAYMAMDHMPNHTDHHDMNMDVEVDDVSSCEGMCLTPEKFSCCGEATSHCVSSFIGSDLTFKVRAQDSTALRLGCSITQFQSRAPSFEPPPPKI